MVTQVHNTEGLGIRLVQVEFNHGSVVWISLVPKPSRYRNLKKKEKSAFLCYLFSDGGGSGDKMRTGTQLP